jgi:cell division protein ZapE
MNPQQRYERDLQSGVVQADRAQAEVVAHLQARYEALLQHRADQKRMLPCLKRVLMRRKNSVVEGVYLWGGVGIGKTYLMDLFYHSLDFPEKKRYHFHHFMQIIHEQLRQYRNHINPLLIIAKQWATQVNVLCLDEFMVMEITDAMILARLLAAFFQQGITLVTTSNLAPDDLYANGLQRELFMPTIALLHQHTDVLHLATGIDYRCRNLRQRGVYFHPLDAQSARKMRQLFAQLTSETVVQTQDLIIADRCVPVKHLASDMVWFDFNVLCHVPRSQEDYLFIARAFHTVFLSGVPVITANQDDLATYFIHLIDILYDAKVKLVINAAAAINALYPAGRLRQRFERTQSRLIEMQSEQYLHAAHVSLVDRIKIV